MSKNFPIYNFKCPKALLSVSSVITNPLLCLLFFLMSVVIYLKDGASVVLSSVPNGESAIAGFFFSKMFNVFHVVDIRDFYPPPTVEFPYLYLHVSSTVNEILIGLFQFLYKHSDRVICVNPHIKKTLEMSGISPSRTLVILNGADTSIYTPCGIERRGRIRTKHRLPLEKPIFVYAGSLASHIPFTSLIRGLKKLLSKTSGFQLLIISHKAQPLYEKLVDELELWDYVRFMGPLPVEETAEILSACDIGIVSHRGGPWKNAYGTKVFSYMACGIPVLAAGSHGSVIDLLIRKHKVGFFVGDPTEENFAEGFLYVLNSERQLQVMGEKARKIVEKYFDRRRLGARLVSLVDELCAETKNA